MQTKPLNELLQDLERSLQCLGYTEGSLKFYRNRCLLQAGVNLIYIRDFLGHADLKTTEIYARTDTETKRKAIENAYPDLIDNMLHDWNQDQALLSWLAEL